MRLFRFGSTLFLLFLLHISAGAQTTFFTETFNNGCNSLCLANTYAGWSISSTGTNGAFANDWYISCAENGNAPGNCGTGCGNDASLHVSNAPGSPGGLCPTGDCGAAYDASLASVVTNRRVESPTIDCSGFINVQMRFDFIASQASPATDFYTVEYSSNGGGTWTNLGNGPGTNCCCSVIDCFLSGCCAPSTTTCGSLRQGLWTQTTLVLPASAANNPNVRIGFNWTNNGDNLGTDPSVAIDDLQLIGDISLHTHLQHFSGHRSSSGVELYWELTADAAVTRVELLRSADGMEFQPIAEFGPGQRSAVESTGQFLDQSQGDGPLFYQLRTRDGLGGSSLSRVLEIHAAPEQRLTLYPNPIAQGQPLFMEVVLDGPKAIECEVWDLKGEILESSRLNAPEGSSHLALELPELPAGMYLVRVNAGGGWKMHKLVVR